MSDAPKVEISPMLAEFPVSMPVGTALSPEQGERMKALYLQCCLLRVQGQYRHDPFSTAEGAWNLIRDELQTLLRADVDTLRQGAWHYGHQQPLVDALWQLRTELIDMLAEKPSNS